MDDVSQVGDAAAADVSPDLRSEQGGGSGTDRRRRCRRMRTRCSGMGT